MTNVLGLSAAGSVGARVAGLDSTERARWHEPSGMPAHPSSPMSESTPSLSEAQGGGGENFGRRLPIALPRGFAALQHRVPLSDVFLATIGRTACFDFHSMGVEARLNDLLFDIIMGSTATPTPMTTPTMVADAPHDMPRPAHPIQNHLRIACTCLTIFQGQRAEGAQVLRDEKYERGLEAALAEAALLESPELQERESAEAALWACFIISVTTGSMPNRFFDVFRELFRDLQLEHWEPVRVVLLKFIYPGSYLDERCRLFFDGLYRAQIETT